MTKQFTVRCGFAAYHANTVSVEADTLEEALEKAIEVANQDPDWKSVDHCGPSFVDACCMGRDEDPWDRDKSLPIMPVQACRPHADLGALNPRPMFFWPDDLAALAEALLAARSASPSPTAPA